MFNSRPGTFRSLAVTVLREIRMTRHSSLAQCLKSLVRSQSVEEGIFVDCGVRAIVAINRNLQHAQSGFGLAAICSGAAQGDAMLIEVPAA